MPRLVRLYMISILIGLVLALAFTGLLVALDIGGLRRLVLGSAAGWLGALMLVVFNTIVFSGVQFGIAVMQLAAPESPGSGRREPPRNARRVPYVCACGCGTTLWADASLPHLRP